MVLVHFHSARGTEVFLTRFSRLSFLQSDNEEKVSNFASQRRFFIQSTDLLSSWRGCLVRPNQITSFEFPRTFISIYLIRDPPERAFNEARHSPSEFEWSGFELIA